MINRLGTLQYYICSVLDGEVDIVDKRVNLIIGSGRCSTIYVVYWMVKLALLTKGLG